MKFVRNIIYTLAILGVFTIDGDSWTLKFLALAFMILAFIVSLIETRKEEKNDGRRY